MKDLYKLFFDRANDPGFVIDLETSRLIDVNHAFTQLTGWLREDVARGAYATRDLIYPDDLVLFDTKVSSRREVQRERYTIRILNSDGQVRHVDVSVATIDHEGKRLVVGSLRDITAQKRLEKTLQSEIARQRNMTYKAAQASVRIGQVLEKLRSVPALARELLTSQTREVLIDNVVRGLTAGDKFSYARVIIYMKTEDGLNQHLRVVADSDHVANIAPAAAGPERCEGGDAPGGVLVPLSDVPQVAQAIVENQLVSAGLTYVIPMRNRTQAVGALLVEFHQFEKNLFDENATIQRAQQDTVKTIGNLVGLGLENLQLYEKLQRQALMDQLTGIHNRRYLELKITELREQYQDGGPELCLVIFDIDRFKGINDRLGHHAGDQVLLKVAKLLERCFQSALVRCRLGGDEFVVLAPGTPAEVGEAAEELRKAVEVSGWDVDGVEPTRVTISIGVASFDVLAEKRVWLMEADQALYQAKQRGRNRVEISLASESV